VHTPDISADWNPRQAAADKLVESLTARDRKLDRKKKRRFAPTGDSRSLQYLREIERVLSRRYGSVLPDDDAGHDDLRMVVAAAKAAGKDPAGHVRKLAPWMQATEANRLCVDVDFREAYISADERAARLGVTYAVRQILHLREIGSTDVDKAGRERLRRQRYDDERRAKAAEKPPKPILSDREKAIVKMVGTGQGMGDLARRAGRSAPFRDLANVPLEVRRVVARLVESGELGQRLEPRERGGKEYYIWNERIAKAAEAQQNPEQVENAPRETPVFKGSNRGAFACVIPPEAKPTCIEVLALMAAKASEYQNYKHPERCVANDVAKLVARGLIRTREGVISDAGRSGERSTSGATPRKGVQT
jgi:hypothetical protein